MVVVERGALCKCVTFAISTHHNNAAMQFINILATVSCLHNSRTKIRYSAIPYRPAFYYFLFKSTAVGLTLLPCN